MAEVVVTLCRQEGTSEEDCAKFLWCLGHRVGHGHEVPLPDDRSMLVAPTLQDITISQTDDLDSARLAVAKAAEKCDERWERYYTFAGSQPAPSDSDGAPKDEPEGGAWKGYAPRSD